MAPLAKQGGAKKTNPHPPIMPSMPSGKAPAQNERIKGTKPPQAGANNKTPKFSK